MQKLKSDRLIGWIGQLADLRVEAHEVKSITLKCKVIPTIT